MAGELSPQFGAFLEQRLIQAGIIGKPGKNADGTPTTVLTREERNIIEALRSTGLNTAEILFQKGSNDTVNKYRALLLDAALQGKLGQELVNNLNNAKL